MTSGANEDPVHSYLNIYWPLAHDKYIPSVKLKDISGRFLALVVLEDDRKYLSYSIISMCSKLAVNFLKSGQNNFLSFYVQWIAHLMYWMARFLPFVNENFLS